MASQQYPSFHSWLLTLSQFRLVMKKTIVLLPSGNDRSSEESRSAFSPSSRQMIVCSMFSLATSCLLSPTLS